MTALSIVLPEKLALASKKAAKQLGVSRAEFIRQAISHELAQLEIEREQQLMLSAFTAMKKNKQYLNELSELDEGFDSSISKESKEWWKKKR